MIWFTADHHFGHANIIRYCNRPFSNSEEMDSEMIDRWNEVVNRNDKVYYLGDFTLFPYAEKYYQQLNGDIEFIYGGHDWRWWKGEHQPQLKTVKENGLIIILSHYPLEVWDRSHYGSLHLHGHSHGGVKKIKNRMDVGVDCHNFYPVSLETILRSI